MLVVSDTSPISALLQIGRAELLRDLFGTDCVPPAVSHELARFHAALPPFIDARTVSDQTRVRLLLTQLDIGEAEAIVLAAESNADYLLIDERRGRKSAAEVGVPIIGLIGVLLLAKNRGLVPTVKQLLNDLQTNAGFYIHPVLAQRLLEAAGE